MATGRRRHERQGHPAQRLPLGTGARTAHHGVGLLDPVGFLDRYDGRAAGNA
jgi:hypothetical protein